MRCKSLAYGKVYLILSTAWVFWLHSLPSWQSNLPLFPRCVQTEGRTVSSGLQALRTSLLTLIRLRRNRSLLDVYHRSYLTLCKNVLQEYCTRFLEPCILLTCKVLQVFQFVSWSCANSCKESAPESLFPQLHKFFWSQEVAFKFCIELCKVPSSKQCPRQHNRAVTQLLTHRSRLMRDCGGKKTKQSTNRDKAECCNISATL